MHDFRSANKRKSEGKKKEEDDSEVTQEEKRARIDKEEEEPSTRYTEQLLYTLNTKAWYPMSKV